MSDGAGKDRRLVGWTERALTSRSLPFSPQRDHLVGLVVKASASRAGGPGFESR